MVYSGGVQVNFGFQIDQLSLMMMMIITGIGSLFTSTLLVI
jgi:NADH-quinone oxidoreductase subunit L